MGETFFLFQWWQCEISIPDLTNSNGNTISLKQHGIQTAKNKNPKLPIIFNTVTLPPIAISMWNDEAQVLSRT